MVTPPLASPSQRPWAKSVWGKGSHVRQLICATESVTDKLRSYGAAMKVIGNVDKQEIGRWLNNRAENSHLPFRRRERAMLRFRRTPTLQRFVAVHAAVYNHFNLDRHLSSRTVFRRRRDATLAEWRALAAG